MKKSFLFDACGALSILLFSLLFQTFNMGGYSFGSFIGFAIGSAAVGLARMKFLTQAAFFSSLAGLAVIFAVSMVIIRVFPIGIRDVGDVIMPYINMSLNGIIYLFIVNGLKMTPMLLETLNSFKQEGLK